MLQDYLKRKEGDGNWFLVKIASNYRKIQVTMGLSGGIRGSSATNGNKQGFYGEEGKKETIWHEEWVKNTM